MVARGEPERDLIRETSFNTFLAGERTRLIRFCTRLTGNPYVAEDLAQETLLEAWRNQQKLSARDLMRGENRAKWLLAIARNICLRWGRSHGRELAHLAPYTLSAASDGKQELDLDELPATDSSLDVELERDELAQLLDRALALLPPTTRAVLIERYIHESSHAEIAERLGLSEDALVQRLYRGKLALRRVMETELNAEAAAYGLVNEQRALEGPLEQGTRIWCPFCNKTRLVKYEDVATREMRFICPSCWQITGLPRSPQWDGLQNPRSILNRQLAYLSELYWQAINQGQTTCALCGRPVQVVVFSSQDIPEGYRWNYGSDDCRGFSYRCTSCGDEGGEVMPHLSLDVPEAQQFWRQHPRMFWLPEHEITYACQPALLSGFQSAGDSARLDIIYQRKTLKILGIHETTC